MGLTDEELEDFEIYMLAKHRALCEGALLDVMDELNEPDPWTNCKDVFISKKINQKTILEAFVNGVLKAQNWPPWRFELPEGFTDVINRTGISIHTLGSPDNDIVNITLNELVDKHMRAWIKEDQQIQAWISKGVLADQCILLAAFRYLLTEREFFEVEFKKEVAVLRKMMRGKKMPKKEKNIIVPYEQAPPPAMKFPSGLMPAVSGCFPSI